MYKMNENLVFPGLAKKKREQLIERIKKTVMPDDVIASIFSFLTVEQIPLDVKKIHSAIFELKNKYPEMFKEFVFSRKDYYPHSVLLERVLFRLQNADLINTVNPDFKVCIVSKNSKRYIKQNIVTLFAVEDKNKLAEMGQFFQKSVLATS